MLEERKSIKPMGSFVSKERVVEGIQDEKLKELEHAQDDARKQRSEDEEKKRLAAIDELLPAQVNASFGPVPYSLFKERFDTVWKQVADKDHLARGYCVYQCDPTGSTPVGIRTLRSGEMKFLRHFTPIIDPAKDPAGYLEEDTFFRNVRFALAATSFGSEELPDIPYPKKRILKEKDVDEWLAQPTVANRMNWIESLPEEFTDAVAGAFVDLSLAYRYALQENLKNQFAPPSHS